MENKFSKYLTGFHKNHNTKLPLKNDRILKLQVK